MAGNEGQPERNLPIESYFPKDIFPTGHFLAKLPGFDKEYSRFIPAREISSWNGKTTINGQETIIRIGHTHGETTIMLDREIGQEVWEINEGYFDFLLVSMMKAVIPVTVLLPNHSIRFYGNGRGDPVMRAHLYFKERLPREKMPFNVQRPRELSSITEGMIDLEESRKVLKRGYNWGWGFDSVEQVLESLSVLKKAIATAIPIEPLEDEPPNRSSNTLISRDYFPE